MLHIQTPQTSFGLTLVSPTFLRVQLPRAGSWLLWVPGPCPSGGVQAGNGSSPPVSALPSMLGVCSASGALDAWRGRSSSVGLSRELEVVQSPFLFSTWPLKSPSYHHTWFNKYLPWRAGAVSDGNAGTERLNLAANQDRSQRCMKWHLRG